MGKRGGVLFAAVLCLLPLAGCGGGSGAAVTVLGSTSMEAVMGTLAEQYSADHPDVRVTVEGGGSSAGIEAVRGGSANIGLVSRALAESEQEDSLRETVLALDGIAVIVHQDNPVTDLSGEQLARIFTGQVTSWAQVGGADLSIACVGRESGSGTREGFESATGTGGSCVLTQELTSSGAVLEAVRGNPQAVGYVSLPAAQGQQGVKVLTVDGVSPTEETVREGSYPLCRPFVLVTPQEDQMGEAALAFFRWATSADAAPLIRQAGAVPAV
jgi:phosphate transport system substrate-binding protein